MAAKIIVYSSYTKNIHHVTNYLTYAGQKLETQEVVFEDGSVRSVDPDLPVDAARFHKDISKINIRMKNGNEMSFSPFEYSILVSPEIAERDFTPKGYIDYIGNRPGVEKDESLSGLFDMNGSVPNEKALELAEQYEGHTWWMQVISLKREDADVTGFNNRKAWESLIKSNLPRIAKVYNISMENMVFFAAYHDKESNPHVHLCYTSKNKREGYVPGGTSGMAKASGDLKSIMFNQIYYDVAQEVNTLKSESESDLKRNIRESMKRVTEKQYIPDREISEGFHKILEELQIQGSNRGYGRQSERVKDRIDSLLQIIIEKDPVVGETAHRLFEIHRQQLSNYIDEDHVIQEKMSEYLERFFHPSSKNDSTASHNEILKHAVSYLQNEGMVTSDPNPQEFPPEAGCPAVQKKEDTLTASSNLVNMESADIMAPPPAEEWQPDAADLAALSDLPGDKEPAVQKKMDTISASDPFVNMDPADRLIHEVISEKKGAAYRVAKSLSEGKNGFAKNTEEAAALFEQLYTHDQDAFVAYQLGKHYASMKEDIPMNRSMSLEYFHASAIHLPYQQKDTMMPHITKQIHQLEYQEAIDIMFGNNEYVEDPSAAEIRLLRIAQNGDSDANFALGTIYKHGYQDIPQDLKKAVEHYSAAHSNYADRYDLKSFILADYCNSIYRDFEATDLARKLSEGSSIPVEVYANAIQEQSDQLPVTPERILTLTQKYLDGDKGVSPLLHFLSTDAKLEAVLSSAPEYDEDAKKALAIVEGIREGKNYYAAWSDSYRLAHAFLYGKNEILQDIEAGKKYLEWEAKSGNALAIADLGRIYAASTNENELSLSEGYFAEAMTAFREVEKRDTKLQPYLQYRIGNLYEHGNGCEKNITEAIRWYESAAEKNNPSALFALGNICFYGNEHAERDYVKAREYYEKSIQYAIEANPYAVFNLGTIYDKGLGIDPDSDKAAALFQQSYKLFYDSLEKKQDDRVYYHLGNMLYNGIGVEQNLSKAIGMYTKSAEFNNAKAQYMLFRIYLDEKSGRYSPELGLSYLEQSAGRNYSQAQYALGKHYMEHGDPGKGIRYLRLSADQGNTSAMFTLGQAYLHGNGTKKNPEQAAALFHAAATDESNPNAFACYSLGQLYQYGNGIPKNQIQAEKVFHKAYTLFDEIEQKTNSSMIQYRMGMMCLDRVGVQQNYEKAITYLSKAAWNSVDPNAYAMFQLAEIYGMGIGTAADPIQGNQLFMKSMELFHRLEEETHSENVQYRLGMMYLKLSEENDTMSSSVYWLQQAADKGNDSALYQLGKLFWENGQKSEAVQYYTGASQSGNDYATYQLAKIRMTEPQFQDIGQGVRLFEKIANHHEADRVVKSNTNYQLGKHYLSEEYKQPSKGLYYLQCAIENGSEPAIKLMQHYQKYGTIECKPNKTLYACKVMLSGISNILGIYEEDRKNSHERAENRHNTFSQKSKFQSRKKHISHFAKHTPIDR